MVVLPLKKKHMCFGQALKELRAKATQKGTLGGAGLKKSGKK